MSNGLDPKKIEQINVDLPGILEMYRKDEEATQNPIYIWMGICTIGRMMGSLTEDTTDEALFDEELRLQFAKLPIDFIYYLLDVAEFIYGLAHGFDVRSPPDAEAGGEIPNVFGYVSGRTGPPPLSTSDSVDLLGAALGMVWPKTNAFAKFRTEAQADMAVLHYRAMKNEPDFAREHLGISTLEDLMKRYRVSDEGSFRRILRRSRRWAIPREAPGADVAPKKSPGKG